MDLLTIFNMNIIYLLLFIGFLSFLSYCLLKPGKFEYFRNINNLSGSKKKVKKRLNTLKVMKVTDNCDNESVDSIHETRHIEIKNSPEILSDASSLHEFIYPLSSPGKPILRKSEEKILVNKDECLESVWTKIPRDEVEILRSRHSSVVSLSQSDCKENERQNEVKLTRGQKKRRKARLSKTNDMKQKKELKDGNQGNNLSSFNFLNEHVNAAGNSNLNNVNENKLIPDQKNGPASVTSSQSSQNSDKMRSYSSTENHDTNLITNFAVEFLPKTFDNEENNEDFSSQPFQIDFNDSEDKVNLEREIKDLKEERGNFLQKLNEFPPMMARIGSLKKDNELLLKKHDDMERTYNVMKQELTNTLQKNSATEGKMSQYKTEINQRTQYFESEMSKFTNKINIIENDNRTKAVEIDSLKNKIDQLHHLVMEKDKHIQTQNLEISSLNEQRINKMIDCQDHERQIKHMNSKLNDVQNQKQSSHEETQKTIVQMESLKREISKVQKEFDQYKRQAKAREKQQDSIISSFQYQLDERFREQQQSMLLNSENESKTTLSQIFERQMIDSTGDSASSDASLISIIREDNRRLQTKCDKLELTVDEYKFKEAKILEDSEALSDRYSENKNQSESNLMEITKLRKSVETLQTELSKNSNSTIDDLQLELDSKIETLRSTEVQLVKLHASIDDKEAQWRESSNGLRQDIQKLENELKCQASLVKNQNQKITELSTLLQSYSHDENESMFNGALA